MLLIIITNNIITNKKEDNKVKKSISKVVEKFYEDSYYDVTPKKLLKDFTDKGIKLSLKELIEFEEISSNKYKKYNINKSKITIYPKPSYEREDYEIEIKLYRK